MEISIIIATFNAEKTLERCLKSIVNQQGHQTEIVVIDGGSIDKTVSIISKFNDNIAYWCSEKDKGIYDAWNKALEHVSGEWVMFLGADDYLLDNALQTYLDYIHTNNLGNIDIISAKCKYVNEKGKLISIIGTPYDYNIFRKYMNISHGSTLHNHKLFHELGGFNLKYKICADYEFLLRRRLRSRFIDFPLICMQTGGMSYTMKALNETFFIRKKKNSVSLIVNCFLYIKGLLGLYYKKRCSRLKACKI